jgi:hypothetical protein
MGACSFGATRSPDDSAFDSPLGAAEAFASGELPEFEPWEPADGACRILLIGDSLVEASVNAQESAFTYLGCESIVDGLAARTLSEGWQCLADGGTSLAIIVRQDPEAGNPTCRPSGLELLEKWSEFTRSASVTVIALGTNDAGSFARAGWIRRWNRAVDLIAGPIVFVTAAARPGTPWVDKVGQYNSALREWCSTEPRCTLAAWDETEVANDPDSYVDHVHQTRVAGEIRAFFIAVTARRAAMPAPLGPSRWRAPEISLPPSTTSTVIGSSNGTKPIPFPEQSMPTMNPPMSATSTVSTTVAPSVPAEESSATTTLPDVAPNS